MNYTLHQQVGTKTEIEAASSFPKACYEAQETDLQVSKPRIVTMLRQLAEGNGGFGG